MVPECTRHYLLALTRPFDAPKGACVPDMHAVPSRKFTKRLRFSAVTGTSGYGFVAMSPSFTANDYLQVTLDSLDSRVHMLAYSNASYAANGISTNAIVAPSTNGVSQTSIPTPYTHASYTEAATGLYQAGSDIKARVVGAGIRIKYSGTELNRGGTVYAVRSPDGHTLHGRSFAELGALETTTVMEVTGRKWSEVNWVPCNSADYEYSRRGDTSNEHHGENSTTGTSTADWLDHFEHNIGLAWSSTPGNTFQVEAVIHLEYTGSGIDSVTPSHSDIQGMSDIRNNISFTAGFYETLASTVSGFGQGMSEIGSRAGNAAAYAGTQYLYNRYAGNRPYRLEL